MNFEGFKPNPIERWSSLCEQDDPTNLPLGVLPIARNCRFHLTSVRTRDGIQNTYGFQLPDKGAVTGIVAQKIGTAGADLQVPLAFSSLGDLYIETPAGSGQMSPPIVPPTFALPAGASMQAASAYKKNYLAFTNLKNAAGPPAVYNPLLNTLDPLSAKQVGQLWTPATQYYVGEVITPAPFVNGVASGYPVGGNGHSYQCTVAGLSGAAQPVFPTTEGGTVADNAVTWTEVTPVMAQAIPVPAQPAVTINAGAGAFAATRDIYVALTYVNGVGETSPGPYFVYANSVLNDQLAVPAPGSPAAWITALPAPYAITGYNVYEADVAHGAGIPSYALFKKVNVGAIPIANPTVINSSGLGAAPPAVNGALIVPAGNICFGLRYAVVLFVNRNGYISGMTAASVISYNGPSNGYQLYVPHIPIGPPGTVARIFAPTPAGQLGQLAGTGISNAGPYFWIAPAFPNGIFDLTKVPPGVSVSESVNGVPMTSTLINDNVSTTATFNFTDDYLKATLNDVSGYFRKIQVPPCSDIYYAKSIRRMFYAVDTLPSGWYVSLLDDPESIYGDTSAIVQCAENNGQNRVAVREYGGIVYLLKEEGGHVLDPNPDDTGKWLVKEQWAGSGPCGPRAADVCTAFMCYVHRSGVWIFQGGVPFRISKEIPLTWLRINWAAQQTIWVMIDDETREIRIGLPLDGSLVPSHVLKLNYEESPQFAPPIFFSHYMGKEIAAGECYKWSVDDIAANLAIRAKRVLQNPGQVDAATVQSQILYASSNADGWVTPIIPFVFDDSGAGIDFQIETAAPQDLLRPTRLGGVQANVDGYGQLSVQILALRAKDPQQGGLPPKQGGQPAANAGTEITLKKPIQAGIPYSCGGTLTNERLRLRITNRKQPGVWGDVKFACIFGQPVTSARPK